MSPETIVETLLHHYQKPSFDSTFLQLQPKLDVSTLKELVIHALSLASKNQRLAIQLINLIDQIADHLNSSEAGGLSAWAKGAIFNQAGRFEESLKYNRLAEKFYRQTGNLVSVTGLQINNVATLSNMGRYQEAIALAEEARVQLEQTEFPSSIYEANLEINLGLVYRQTGAFEEALGCYERARVLYRQLDDQESVADTISIEGLIWLEQGNFQRAEPLLLQASKLYEAADSPHEKVRVEVNRGRLEHQRGRHLKALQIFEYARQRFQEFNDPLNIADTDLYRAYVYFDLNLLDETIELAHSAEKRYRRLKDGEHATEALMLQAKSWQYAGQHTLAQKQMDKARRWLRRAGSKPRLHQLDIERGHLALAVGNPQRARRIGRRLLKIEDVQQAPLLLLKVHLLLASCAVQSGGKAINHCQAGFQIARSLGMTEYIIQLHAIYGRYWAAADDLNQAEQNYLAALQLLEQQRRILTLDLLQIHYLENKLPLYRHYIELLHQLETRDGGHLARLAQALNLRHTAPFSRPPLVEKPDDPLQEQLADLQAQWHWQHHEAHQAQPAPAHKLNLHTTEIQIMDLLNRLHVRRSAANSPFEAATISSSDRLPDPQQYLENLQHKLRPGEALLHFYEAHQSCHALLIDRQGCHWVAKLCSSSFIEKLSRAWHFLTHSLVHKLPPDKIAQTSQKYLKQLYQQVLSPLEPFFKGVKVVKVVVLPTWHQLPLAAAYDGTTHWGQRFQITYLTAPDVLFQTQAKNPAVKTKNALLVGHTNSGRLPHTLDEVQEVQEALHPHWKILQLREENARRQSVSEAMKATRLIHLAAHAVFRPDNPLFSRVQVADGDLTLADIEQLQLPHHPLVVLSACDSGRGVPKGGGLFSLARGFLAAGASGVIVSQWAAEDRSAARLMSGFYRSAVWQKEPAAALQGAQQQQISAGVSPVYWANYIYISG
ncbi:MAG: CHAT domain-containing protein [Ardenticatenaceae bacterium]|nr:CHAT domain-containing protein [Ardenticatenaceae bacterium]